MLSWLKRLAGKVFSFFNFEVRKFPATEFSGLPVFNLAVHFLMQKKGPQLFFIQVGANDGIFGDPLRQFILKYGWKGVLVEPQPAIFKQLMTNYQDQSHDLVFENCAISPDHSALVLHVPKITDLEKSSIYKSSVASVYKSKVVKQLNKSVIEEISVPCKTLDNLVAEHGIDSIDVLQIDAEGYDYHVLRSLNFARSKPALIQFETGHMPGRECQKAAQLLHQAGYRIHWGGNHGDAVAMNADLFVDM